MSILVVGNILKDVYLNLDFRTEKLETDRRGAGWLDLCFDASSHHFFHRESSFGGVAVSLEVLQQLGLDVKISDSRLDFSDDDRSVPASQAYFASVPAFCPSAEKVTCDNRFSIISSPSANLSSSQKPNSRAAFSIVAEIFATCSSVKG